MTDFKELFDIEDLQHKNIPNVQQIVDNVVLQEWGSKKIEFLYKLLPEVQRWCKTNKLLFRGVTPNYIFHWKLLSLFESKFEYMCRLQMTHMLQRHGVLNSILVNDIFDEWGDALLSINVCIQRSNQSRRDIFHSLKSLIPFISNLISQENLEKLQKRINDSSNVFNVELGTRLTSATNPVLVLNSFCENEMKLDKSMVNSNIYELFEPIHPFLRIGSEATFDDIGIIVYDVTIPCTCRFIKRTIRNKVHNINILRIFVHLKHCPRYEKYMNGSLEYFRVSNEDKLLVPIIDSITYMYMFGGQIPKTAIGVLMPIVFCLNGTTKEHIYKLLDFVKEQESILEFKEIFEWKKKSLQDVHLHFDGQKVFFDGKLDIVMSPYVKPGFVCTKRYETVKSPVKCSKNINGDHMIVSFDGRLFASPKKAFELNFKYLLEETISMLILSMYLKPTTISCITPRNLE